MDVVDHVPNMAMKTLNARCLCRNATYTLEVPSSNLPLHSGLCSCSSCRYSTGQLAASFATIPIEKEILDLDVSQLSKYNSSPNRSRYFCPRCGANVVDLTENNWRFCTGTLDQTEGLLDRHIIFVDDTRDGGMSIWLKGIGTVGRKSTMILESVKPNLLQQPPLRLSLELRSDARLHGQCHCGGVQFQILPPKDKRYTAGIDTCTSCRLSTGFELTFWTSVPLNKVQMPDGKPLDLDAGTLKCYNSSIGVFRHFCGECGATAFVAKENQSWVDIAAGLLRAEEGARAERWLDWKELGFLEEATDQTLVRKLGQEFKRWGQYESKP
jgi:hypothetical protein